MTTEARETIAQAQTACEEIGAAVGRAFIYFEALDRATLARHTPSLTTAQFHALRALSLNPGQSLGELAERLLCDKANASGIVDRLQAMGMVRRTRTATDLRRVSIDLTADGEEALTQSSEARRACLDAVFVTLDPVELARIHDALDLLTGTLELALRPHPSK